MRSRGISKQRVRISIVAYAPRKIGCNEKNAKQKRRKKYEKLRTVEVNVWQNIETYGLNLSEYIRMCLVYRYLKDCDCINRSSQCRMVIICNP